MNDAPRILALDIETAPMTAHCWGLFKQNVGLNQILDTGRVMCFSAKWVGQKGLEFRSERPDCGPALMLERAHALLDEADAVLTYNGESFDMPTLNREFLKRGMRPPAPYRSIDLYRVVKSRFRFASNKLAHVLDELELPGKVRHEGHELWIKCMNGDAQAWQVMQRYNMRDVIVLERLYRRLLPWIAEHPNVALYSVNDKPTCPNCGSHRLQSRGLQHSRTQSYRRYQCTACGTWSRERFTMRTRKDGTVLTQVGDF